MSTDMKKTHPTAATVEQVGAGAETEQATTSTTKNTTSTPLGQAFRVADLLLRGQENALPLKHLKGLLHADGRTVRRMIQRERLMGTPICEDSRTGYYLPGSVRERDLCAARLRHRAAEIVRVADAIEGAADLD